MIILRSGTFVLYFTLFGCVNNVNESSFNPDGNWILDYDASYDGLVQKPPPPPGTPVYFSCSGDECVNFSRIYFKWSVTGNELRLYGQDSDGVQKLFPGINFGKHPALEYRFRIINSESIEQLQNDRRTRLRKFYRSANDRARN